MKTIPFEVAGHTFHLCLNGQALFDAYDKFGNDEFITKHIEGMSKKSFESVCWLLSKLAEQGELVRRWQGLDRGPIAPVEYFRANLTPHDVNRAKEALLEAVAAGFSREEREKGTRDYYAELAQKKTEKPKKTK